MAPVWLIGFSGHRPSEAPGRGRGELERCRGAVRSVFESLSSEARRRGGNVSLVSSLAAGADMIAVEVALELDLSVHLVLPLGLDQFANDFEGPNDPDWIRLEAIVARINEDLSRHTMRVAPGCRKRPDCYHDANQQILRLADFLVILWNGEVTTKLGSTGEVAANARFLAMPVVTIDSRNADQHRTGDWGAWERGEPLFEELVKLVADDKNDGRAVASALGAESQALQIFYQLSKIADSAGRQFRKRVNASIWLHFTAALIAVTNVTFIPWIEDFGASPRISNTTSYLPLASSILEFVLLAWAIFIMKNSNHSRKHVVWRNTRFAAELCRGILGSARILDPLCPLVIHRFPNWRRFALSFSFQAHRDDSTCDSVESYRERYLNSRLFQQQRSYFEPNLPTINRQRRLLTTLAWNAALIAPVVVLVAIIAKLVTPGWLHHSFLGVMVGLFMPAALPLLAGAVTSWLLSSDTVRRANRFKQLGDRLDRHSSFLAVCKTTGSLEHWVHETEELLMDELCDWYLTSEQQPH